MQLWLFFSIFFVLFYILISPGFEFCQVDRSNAILKLDTFVRKFVCDPFTPDSVKSKITNWVKLKNKLHHCKMLLNVFPTNGHISGFCP